MIKAKNNYWAVMLFDFYIEKLLKKYFSHFYLVNEFPAIKSNDSVVFAPNHFSWWDGFFIDYVLKKESDFRLKIMMLEKQLKKYWFFNYLGAYSIDPSNPASIKETIYYTRLLLNNSNNGVVIYPQGDIEPYEKRPLDLKEGLRSILNSKKDSIIVPIGFKIHYSEEKTPSVICRFGETMTADILVQDFSLFTKTFHNNLNLLDESVSEMNYIKDYYSK